MKMKTINVRVSADAAQIYESATDEEKRKYDALLSSRLREADEHQMKGHSLENIMDQLGRRAQRRGLTPEKLDKVLHEE